LARPFTPLPVQIETLFLSSLGASMDAHGAFQDKREQTGAFVSPDLPNIQHLSSQYGLVGDPANPPSLRTSGFTIARVQRDQAMLTKLRQQTQNAALIPAPLPLTSVPAGSPLTLYADDLVRGYRVDVITNGTTRSLCRRTGTLTLGSVTYNLPTDDASGEGYVKGGATTTPDTDPNRLNVHEAIFGWDGWSLAAQWPGGAISHVPATATAPAGQPVVQNPNTTPGASPLVAATNIQPLPQSLPRLRFGQSYQFRARTVDLAGNSILPSVVNATHASAPVVYGRYEPVVAPALVQNREAVEGESLERMVVRSDLLNPAVEVATCTRHVAPPKIALQSAITHGSFDDLFGTASFDAAYHRARKEAGTFLDTRVWSTGPDPVPTPARSSPRQRHTPTRRPTSAAPLRTWARRRFRRTIAAMPSFLDST
jgi:hypothetical protein